MLKTDDQFHDLMREVMNGSEAAAKELFDDYGPYLLIAIRRRLNKRLRNQFDSLDIAQDVWKSFFADGSAKRVFDSPEQLLAFLTALARNKVVDATRQRLTGAKRDVNREQSLDDSRTFDKGALAGAQPTPSRIVMSQEEWSEFLRRQPPVYRRIFILLYEGMTVPEIAQETGIEVHMVRRVVERYLPEATS
jgi:RNA polymerase sigma factor (sigma-70 family)